MGTSAFNAFDAMTGQELWRHPLTVRTTGTPMTYRTSDSDRVAPASQFVVIATGSGENAELVAFALR